MIVAEYVNGDQLLVVSVIDNASSILITIQSGVEPVDSLVTNLPIENAEPQPLLSGEELGLADKISSLVSSRFEKQAVVYVMAPQLPNLDHKRFLIWLGRTLQGQAAGQVE